MRSKTSLLSSKPAANVYISPHTRSSGGGVVTPPPRIDAYEMQVW